MPLLVFIKAPLSQWVIIKAMEYRFKYVEFSVEDGNSMTLGRRILEAFKLLQNENGNILLENGKMCRNEQTLQKGGIL